MKTVINWNMPGGIDWNKSGAVEAENAYRERVWGEMQEMQHKFPSAPAPKPTPTPTRVDAVPLEGAELEVYERAAAAIGFAPVELLEAKLLAFFRAKNLPLYDAEQVDAYMDRKAGEQRMRWHWCPLRPDDMAIHDVMPYSHAVPLRTLLVVQDIVSAFGKDVCFFVSDYQVKKPDPFIMVRARRGGRAFIFDFWDEPDFGVKAAESK